MPEYAGRDWNERAFTIGIGGYVVEILNLTLTLTGPWDPERRRFFSHSAVLSGTTTTLVSRFHTGS